MNSKYAIGIDLGTTNSALAYRSLETEDAPVECLAIPQLVDQATEEARTTLPSFMYLGTEDEGWNVGEWARRRAAEAPGRTVAAAKSWLCHSRVDRHEAILPWGAPDDVAKCSPVEASKRYLQHLADAWNAQFPDAPFAKQELVLTVPASFDSSARELTSLAAKEAGLPKNFILLEEPQSAVYAWLAEVGDDWRKQLNKDDTLLVCDVGGGTTDFTLVRVEDEDGDLVLRRVAVGNHILVGGDNMDLFTAHIAQQAFAEQGVTVDAWQSTALWHACRQAKENLLDPAGAETHPVTVLGRGRKVIGGNISVDLNRQQISDALLEGFFPACKLADRPQRTQLSGFRELGLPYEHDTAITRHLAAFLGMHAEDGASVRPTHVLFNGGVFKSDIFKNRLMELMGSWFDKAPQLLDGNEDLDHAVATGGAFYAAAKHSGGIRIRGGTARAYYLGIETAGLAIPGAPRPLNAFCVVPAGMEEGTEIEVPGDSFGLVTGEPAHFRVLSSAVRKQDKPGDLLGSWTEEELQETDSLEAELPAAEGAEDGGGYIPVRFESRVTELGIFELWCVSTITDHRWKLEFSVRED
ncbi:Hsp70 family protein [Pontiella sulfatireligans]|uniref:Chaperone protein DnaK n=1 Tax=Pontiella sulfatireligans TaxID=2750658 RepID=A0A6C2ULR0_9BACT|nr:Hsp70 family protein [Pontiella sulfatireligans]VGO20281.1 Chaperone protein DnaK [Pontiella sulfatireligans]